MKTLTSILQKTKPSKKAPVDEQLDEVYSNKEHNAVTDAILLLAKALKVRSSYHKQLEKDSGQKLTPRFAKMGNLINQLEDEFENLDGSMNEGVMTDAEFEEETGVSFNSVVSESLDKSLTTILKKHGFKQTKPGDKTYTGKKTIDELWGIEMRSNHWADIFVGQYEDGTYFIANSDDVSTFKNEKEIAIELKKLNPSE